jgi:AAA domain
VTVVRKMDSYIEAAIAGEVERLGSAVEGERNSVLFKCAAAVAALGVTEGQIIRAFKPAADAIGLRGAEFYRTIKSGVSAGCKNPRSVVTSSATGPATCSPTLIRTDAISGADGPSTLPDEVRRHPYRRDGVAVRVKIKRRSGVYSNWYAVEGAKWQPWKPDGYRACPYVGAVDPFSPQQVGQAIYWPEGERDVETLRLAGLPAFTFGGTGDGLPPDIDHYLKDRDIVIFADNDVGGKNHAIKKAERAQSAGAARIRIVEFEELPSKGDVSDYLEIAGIDDLRSRVQETPEWKPTFTPKESEWRKSVVSASELKTRIFNPIRFALPGYIPEGVTIFAGKPKIGKSWFLFDVCVACSGDRFVLGDLKPQQGDVLYLALEDSPRRLKKRLEKLCPVGSWPERLTLASEWKRADQGGLQHLEEWCDSVTNPRLIVIDTLEKFRPAAKPGASAYSIDYGAIAGLQTLAQKRGIAIVVIHHVRKMEADDPFDMVSGTNGLTGAADTILVLRKQSGNATLYAKGRDIDEKETACAFSKDTCRWTLLGEADAVHGSGERTAVLEALKVAASGQMPIAEIMAATERRDRNAVDQLLFKMQRDGDLVRVKRGVYGLPGKIGKKERKEDDPVEE